MRASSWPLPQTPPFMENRPNLQIRQCKFLATVRYYFFSIRGLFDLQTEMGTRKWHPVEEQGRKPILAHLQRCGWGTAVAILRIERHPLLGRISWPSSHLTECTHDLPCIRHTHVFDPNFQEKKSFVWIFVIQLFIYLHLDACFLYYKGILAFLFERIMAQEILCNK